MVGMATGRSLLPPGVGAPADLAALLDAQGYLADEGLATAAYLALALPPLLRLQCYEGIDAAQALYDWDFPRQLMHLRAAEAAGRAGDQQAVEDELYGRRFLGARPLLAALETTPCVLLVDEIDRANDEFEAFLLEVLSEF